MKFQDVVRKRKMVRSFEDRAIPPEALERILSNARRAPSAGNSQGYELVVFDGRDEVARFWDVTDPDRRSAWPDLYNAALVLVPCSDPDVYIARYSLPDKGWVDRSESHWPVPFWEIDAAMSAMLILLTAVDLGLGALYFGIFKMKEFKEAFGVPERVTPIGAIAVGWPKADNRPSLSLRIVGRRSAEETIHRGRWGGRGGPA